MSDEYRLREIAAAALQHLHREPALPPRQREPQRCGGGERALAGAPPQNAPGAAFARGNREPAHRAIVVRAEPRERSAAFGRTQRLLVGPELIGGAAAADDQKPRE